VLFVAPDGEQRVHVLAGGEELEHLHLRVRLLGVDHLIPQCLRGIADRRPGHGLHVGEAELLHMALVIETGCGDDRRQARARVLLAVAFVTLRTPGNFT
jgi:hypothetical protein